MYEYIGFEHGTGLLLENRPDGFVNPQDATHSLSSETVDKFISDLSAKNLSGDDHLNQLTDQLDLAIVYKGSYSHFISNLICFLFG